MAPLEKIGKYEILAKIGEGGFGIVYKGKDPFIKRLVAVKTCSSENEAIQKRFFREAEIAGNLHHANVVTIHDFGVEGETPYLVQEFLTGEDLDVLITDPEHQLSLPTKVRYLRGIGEGLRYAHAQGVIHRDIKPANIRILENNRVKVMDFGIAKLRDQESQLTQTGMALGTVAYMSPEQLKGESVDHRVDIFSFGVLAYELVVGRRPFQAESVSTLFYQLLHENPPEITDPEVPKQLVEVIEKCLAKSLDVRYGSFDEVLADLDAVQKLVGDEEEVTADPFSTDPTSALTRLAAKAARSIDAGDLTAAEATLDLARKEYDAATFDREFGELVEALNQKRATRTTDHPAIPGLDIESQIQRIDQQLAAGKIDTAAVAFTALEMQFPDDPRVTNLRSRVSQAVHLPPPTGATPAPPAVTTTPVSGQQPSSPAAAPAVPGAGTATRQRARTGPLVAAAAAVILLVVIGAIFAVRFFGGDSEADVPGENGTQAGQGAQTTAGGETEPADTSLPQTPAAGADAGDGQNGTAGGESDPENTTPGAGDTSGPATEPEQTSGGATRPATPPPSGGGRTTDNPSTSAAGNRPSSGSGGSSNRPSSTEPSTSSGGGSSPGRDSSSQATRPTRPQPKPITPTVEPEPRDRPSQNQPTTPEPADQGTPADRSPAGQPAVDTRPAEPEPEPDTGFDMERFRIQNDIRAVLDAYRDAWISRDEDVINNYYPGENVSRRDVRQFRTVEAEVACDSFDIADSGTSATANCTITIVKRPKNGDPVTTRYTRAELVKQGTRWLISSLN